MSTITPQAPMPPKTRHDDSSAQLKAWVTALNSEVPHVRTPILYRIMQLLVVLVMLILPVIYIGLIGLLGYVVYLHAANDTAMFTEIRGGRATVFMFILYLAPIVGGVVSIFFMVKPFFAPRMEKHIPVTLTAQQQPKLFVLVENLCHAIDAPVPTQIVVDTQVNASASFRKGMLSFLGNDLTLTIGLPLVSCLSMNHFVGILAHEFGHFSQGAGMRLSYVINRISHWFARVVYERDKWDQTLAEFSQQNESGWLMLFIACVRLMVWLSRCVLWILMYIGRIASCLLMRQMEYDADRHEASIAGYDGFEKTVYELHRINFGLHLASEHMRQFTSENQAPDNIPGLIAYHAQQIDKEQRQGIAKLVQDTRTGLFSTHPSDKSRIKSSKKTEFPGIFHFSQPASALFEDYNKLCRGVTMHTLHHQCGENYKRLQLVNVNKLQKEHQQIQAGQSNSQAYLGACTSPLSPLIFPGHITDKITNVKEAVANLKTSVAKARQMVADPTYEQWNDKQAEAYTRLIDLKEFVVRKDYGIRDSPKTIGLHADSKQALADYSRKLNHIIKDAHKHLEPFNTLQTKRILTALQVLHHPVTDKMKNMYALRADSKKQFLAYRAISSIHGQIMDLNQKRHECIGLLKSVEKFKEDEMYINKILSQSKEMAGDMRTIRTMLMDHENPYASPDDPSWKLGSHIIPKLTDPKDVGSTVDMAGNTVEKCFTCGERILADLIRHAQVIEKAAGISEQKVSKEAPTES